MPVRPLNSSLLRCSDAQAVITALRYQAVEVSTRRPELLHAGIFGSYASGRQGVGSDPGVVLIVADSFSPFLCHAAD